MIGYWSFNFEFDYDKIIDKYKLTAKSTEDEVYDAVVDYLTVLTNLPYFTAGGENDYTYDEMADELYDYIHECEEED